MGLKASNCEMKAISINNHNIKINFKLREDKKN